MAENTTASTESAGGAGFPPFKTETFPSQLFWLAVTFAFLFVMLWKAAGPRIHGVISSRRGAINADIAAAQKARGDAESASAAYQTALAGARARANAHAEQTRQTLNAEIAKAKAEADAEAQKAMSAAQGRIDAMQVQARGAVATAAQEAAIAIVARLTGETVTAAEAAAAVKE
jgi:F-type H+-transporting ATPase subunit b